MGVFRFFKRFNPTGAIGDFVSVWQQAGRRRWAFVAAAAVTTTLVFSLVTREEYRVQPKPPEIVWINSWPADRSDAEIRASNLVNQKRKEAEEAAQARRDEDVRQIYKAIGRMSGMDVDGIERRAKAEQAASAAAEQAQMQRMTSGIAPK
jgi:hypothetical protein